MDCPTCHGTLSEADKRAGPEEPEIGWEYYVCPDCGERMHPAVVEPDSDGARRRPEARERFEGTVVDTGEPITLDDGDEVVECFDLSEDVKLGSQVTVVGRKRGRSAGGNDGTDFILRDCSLER